MSRSRYSATRSFTLSNIGSVNNTGSLEMSTPLPTYDQFQQTRTQRKNTVAADIRAKKEQQLMELNNQLQDILTQINQAQMDVESEEREYLSEKESLVTEIKRIAIEFESRSAELRMNHLSEMESLQAEHQESLAKYVDALGNLRLPVQVDNKEDEELEGMRRNLRSSERQMKVLSVEDENEQSTELDGSIYAERIVELENQKRELVREVSEEEEIARSRVSEMAGLLDEQEARHKSEIGELQEELRRLEEKHGREMEKLERELGKVEAIRGDATEKKRARIAELQKEIDGVDGEFKEKLRQASRVAEKLKTALLNANARKSQQLELERQRSEEHQRLLGESFELQQKSVRLERELQRARNESATLRKELSAKIGPRRTASLFN